MLSGKKKILVPFDRKSGKISLFRIETVWTIWKINSGEFEQFTTEEFGK